MGVIELSRARPLEHAGPPHSGTSGEGVGVAHAGDLLVDTTNQVLYINEGDATTPYWTPLADNPNIFGVFTDFRDTVGKALANTDAAAIVAGSGLRIFGQGIAETDSGAVANAAAEGGYTMRLTTTDEDAHTVAIGIAAGTMQPDQHSMLVVDTEITNVTAITARALFVGFLGTAADALDPAVTGATTVATLVQDDLAGLWMDAGLTDADRIFAVHNKSDESATQNLALDGDTSTDMAAAATYQRFRVEIDADGDMVAFIDKAQVYSTTEALDEDEECSPVLYLESQDTADISIDVKHFHCWATRA
jgi:hypothetical protein